MANLLVAPSSSSHVDVISSSSSSPVGLVGLVVLHVVVVLHQVRVAAHLLLRLLHLSLLLHPLGVLEQVLPHVPLAAGGLLQVLGREEGGGL